MGRFFSFFPTIVVIDCVLIFQTLFAPLARAEADAGAYTVRKEEPTYKGGSIFVSSNKKNEVLVKANLWGAVQFPGVHYIPLGTRFLEAISFAGGPLDAANIEIITLSSKPTGSAMSSSIKELSVKDALLSEKNNPVLQPDDIIFVKEDHTREKVTLYLAIGTFLVSAAALGVLIARR